MGFTNNSGRVRVDLFKSTGKWYETGSVDMNSVYDELDVKDAVLKACKQEFLRANTKSEWPVSSSPDQWLDQGGFIVCLDPYHKHSVPIILCG